MAQLPVETWRQITEDHLQAKEFLALSTTSSFFCSISQELLYRDVTLARYERKHDDMNSQIELFSRSLRDRPELAAFVRSLTMAGHMDMRGMYPGRPIRIALELLPMLRYLKVHSFNIDTAFLSALQGHPRLTKVEVSFCTMPLIPPSIMDPQAWSGTSVSNVILDFPTSPWADVWAVLAPPGLRSLGVTQVDSLFVGQFFSKLLVHGTTNTLTSLSIGSLPPNIVSVLTSSAQLCRLSLGPDIHPDDPHPFRSLQSDAIPFLEYFAGPAEFLEVLVRGRPVHTVTVAFDPKTPVNVLTALRLSSVPVTELILISNPSIISLHKYLAETPVSVRYFAWEGDQVYEEDFMSYCLVFSRWPSLVRIRADMWRIRRDGGSRRSTLSHRTDMVRAYSEACQSVKVFDFGAERWLRRNKDGGWERYEY